MAAQLKVVSNKSRKLESSEIADLILQNKFEHREYPYSIYLYSLI